MYKSPLQILLFPDRPKRKAPVLCVRMRAPRPLRGFTARAATQELPNSVETEIAVLGAVLLNNAAFEQLEGLDASEFYLDSHRVIYSAMREMSAAAVPVDVVTLVQRFIDNGQLDRIGGPAYLSSLTDGLPRLSNVSHYVKVIKDKAAARRMVATGAAISQAAAEGVPAAELAELVQNALPGLEGVNGKPGGVPGKVADKIYPTVPDKAWCDTAKVYYDSLKESTSASEAYHLAIFIASAGMVLGRTVHATVADTIYPNFYVALVGRAGKAKKGTAMNKGIALVTAVAPQTPWLSSVDSAEGFVNFLSQGQKTNESKDSPGLLYFSEMRTLIEKAKKEGSTIVPKLAEAFDCGEKIEVGTRNNPLKAPRPFVSIFGGASPTWLEALTMADLEGGLGSRFMWIPSNPKRPFANPPPKNQTKWNSVVGTLHKAREYWDARRTAGQSTEFRFTPAALELWEEWFNNKLWNLLSADPLIEIMGERMDMHCRKVALVYAALERGEPLIDIPHLTRAFAYTEFLIESLYSIFSEFGMSEIVKQEKLILDHIRAAGPGGIRKRVLQKRLWRMDAETFNRRLRWMTGDEGTILEHRPLSSRSTWLLLNE